nr:VCBS repeat-containing protein [Chitinophagales bacterium]
SGGNEYPVNSKYYNDRLYINTGNGTMILSNDTIDKNHNSKSCVKAFDFDDDGDKDLFVGGKLIPGKFPLSPPSAILENIGGVFKDITSEICPELLKAGMVNDALWTDVNNDSKVDLVIVGDWMPIRIFLQKNGKFSEATNQFGLANSSGWWNCISGADFDNDGDTDLIVGNRGTNNQIKGSVSKPATLYAYDFDKNGSLDPILNYYYNDSISHPFASRDDLLDQINILKKKYIYYKDYANATMETIFQDVDLDTIPILKTEIFESVYLENIGGEKFQIKKLPSQAQWFPINSSVIHDFNSDGYLDVIVAGNEHGIRPELGRMDAGFGLLLQGDGMGNFITIPGIESGINIPGETKNMQLVKIAGKKYIIIVKNNEAAQVLLMKE